MSLADLVSAGDAWDAAQADLPVDTGGVDFSTFFANANPPAFDFPDFTLPPGGGMAPPTLDLASGAADVFGNIARLVQVAYQGEAAVQQAKFANKIANARLANQLETVRTTPNIWLVLGLGAAGVFAVSAIAAQGQEMSDAPPVRPMRPADYREGEPVRQVGDELTRDLIFGAVVGAAAFWAVPKLLDYLLGAWLPHPSDELELEDE